MTHDNDEQLAAWLADGPAHGPAGGLESALSRTRSGGQRPGWLVAATGGTIAAERENRSVGPTWGLVAVAALLGLLIGSLVIGGWLRPWPGPDAVLPSASANAPARSQEPTSEPDATPALLGGGLILGYQSHESPSPCSMGSLAPFDLYTLDAGTGERTLLGTTAEDCSARHLQLQWATNREHVLMTDELGQEALTLDTPTAAGRDLSFICCELPTDVWEGGAHQFDGWLLSPHGDRVAAIHTSEFQVPGQEGTTGISDGIVVANIDGSGRISLPLPAGAAIRGWATWSPDQSALVVAACLPCNHAPLGQPATAENHDHVYIVPVDGSPVRELLDDTTGWLWTPAWSPDASTIVTLRRECHAEWVPFECSGQDTSYLVLVGPDGGSQRVIISSEQLGEGLDIGLPLWSRDSTRIAFTAVSPIGDSVRVFVVDADGTNLVDVGEGNLIGWSPDGEWLLVQRPAADENSFELWIMRPDGSGARSLGTFLNWSAAW